MTGRHPHAETLEITHPANEVLLGHLRASAPRSAASRSPDGVDTWKLGTHPDLVEHLWFGITAGLPDTCHWVAHGRPVLVRPDMGVIFGLAGGTNTLALRLPIHERRRAAELPGCGDRVEYPEATVYARDFGDDWIMLRCFGEGLEELCLAAFEYAGRM